MNTQIEPETHFLALATVLIVAFIFALIFTVAALYKRTGRTEEEQDPDLAEVDATYYPDTGEDLYR